VFQRPYYQIAVGGVRGFYRANNKRSVLHSAQNKASNITNKAKRINNVRVLESFEKSPHSDRRFSVQANRRYQAMFSGVEVRLSADMQATEDGTFRVVYFICKGKAIEEATAILIAEVAHWVLHQNGVDLRVDQIEVMDLTSGKSYRARSWRASTASVLAERVKAISSLWDQI
jgi:hypothetical protein